MAPRPNKRGSTADDEADQEPAKKARIDTSSNNNNQGTSSTNKPNQPQTTSSSNVQATTTTKNTAQASTSSDKPGQSGTKPDKAQPSSTKDADKLQEAVQLYGASYGTADVVGNVDLMLPTDWPKSYKGRKLLTGIAEEPDHSDRFKLTSYILERCKKSSFNDVSKIIDSAPTIQRLLDPVHKYIKGQRHPVNLDMTRQQQYSALATYIMVAQEDEQICKKCENLATPMANCVHNSTALNGSCTNCQFSSQANSCTVRDPTSLAKTKRSRSTPVKHEHGMGIGERSDTASNVGDSVLIEIVCGLGNENLLELVRHALKEVDRRSLTDRLDRSGK